MLQTFSSGLSVVWLCLWCFSIMKNVKYLYSQIYQSSLSMGFWVIVRKPSLTLKLMKNSPKIPSSSWIVWFFHFPFGCPVHLELFLCMVWSMHLVLSFIIGSPIMSAPSIFCPSDLRWHLYNMLRFYIYLSVFLDFLFYSIRLFVFSFASTTLIIVKAICLVKQDQLRGSPE